MSTIRSLRRRKARRSRMRPLHLGVETLEPRMVLSAATPLAVPEVSTLRGVADSDFVDTQSDSGGQASIVNGTVVDQSAYPTVGKVISNGACTGTLIAPGHVLTARHCMGPNVTFYLSGDAHAVSRQIAHPTSDLAILVLTKDIEEVTPQRLMKFPPVVTETLTLVGYGNHGTTNDQQPGFGTLREGHTTLQFVEDEHIGWIFDGDGESSHSLGDSGGPAFVERGGHLLIAGVASYITGSPNTPGTGAWDVRIDVFVPWIMETIGSVHLPLSIADFDVDGDVDGADFLIWQESFNVNDGGDANGDGMTNGDDFLIWQSEFGASSGSAAIGGSAGGQTNTLHANNRLNRRIDRTPDVGSRYGESEVAKQGIHREDMNDRLQLKNATKLRSGNKDLRDVARTSKLRAEKFHTHDRLRTENRTDSHDQVVSSISKWQPFRLGGRLL